MNGNGDNGPGYPEAELPQQQAWGRRAQAIAAVLWASFLAAAIATMIFFAFVDPGDMEHAMRFPMEHTRMTGYGLGFFFFWLITSVSSALAVFLLMTSRRNSRDRNNGKG